MSGTLTTGKKAHKSASLARRKKRYALSAAQQFVRARQPFTLVQRLSHKARRQVRRALRHHRKVSANLLRTSNYASGQRTQAQFSIRKVRSRVKRR